jgi:hypothetical protein
MRWWLRVHRTAPLALVLVAFGALAWASTSRGALGGRVPSPIRAGVATPVALWLPLGVMAAVCWACSVDEGRPDRSVTVRSNSRLLAGFVVAAVVSSVLVLAPTALGAPALAAAVARNVVGLVGVAMVLRRWIGGSAATAFTVGYLAIAASLGAQFGGGASWWAFPVSERVGAGDLAPAALAFAAGLAALAVAAPTRRRPRNRDGSSTRRTGP